MIIPLDRLVAYNQNRYIFSRAAMTAVDKLGNIREYPEKDSNWKVVPHIMFFMLNEKLKHNLNEDDNQEKD